METEVLENLEYKLMGMYELLKRNKKSEYVYKVEGLMNKLKEKKVSIAFCGHFSAGKSSFINELFGKHVLPTSPIPTSANIVYVKRGEKGIDLVLQNGQMVECPSEISLNEIKDLCKDGEEVKSIYYHTQEETFSNHLILIDTPGVDSVDEAHALATAEVIHECDYIFYVMDYNHVSARTNLDFLQELTIRQKKVSIVINQIDKHNDEELAFEAYKQILKQTFEQEGITYEHLYFTSLKEKELKRNDLVHVKETLQLIEQNYKKFVEDTIINELNYIMYQAFSYEQQVEDISYLYEKREELTEQLKQEREKIKGQKQNFKDRIVTISKNAYIMTPELREHCRVFLQSKQSDFKVGFLFTKEKTMAEKVRRKDTLWQELKKSIEVNLFFHYVNEIREIEKECGVHIESESIEFFWVDELLNHVLNSQALQSEQYVMKYCQDLSDEIKKVGIKEVDQTVEPLFHTVKSKAQETCLVLETSLQEVEMEIAQKSEENNRVTYMDSQIKEGLNILEGNVQLNKKYSQKEYVCPLTIIKYEEWRKSKVKLVHRDSLEERVIKLEKRKISISDVEEVIWKSRDIKAVHQYRDMLEKKVKGLKQQQYVLALFGAFSAGKSSFANALLGASILPSSPNPTTATVIKIQKGTIEHPSGTVEIQFKDESLLLQEWSSLVGKKLNDIHEIERIALKEIKNLQDKQYVIRLKKSYKKMQSYYGEKLQVDIGSFHPYVRDEELAAYVKEANVYYDSPITRQGVMLVDTPGADSVYGRHTNVAFRFMKDSDGILFVTYYNHAFSKSDREVLIQLGKMKELSSLESIYFIINAIDLAQSEEEKKIVQDYVTQQLLQYGITRPKVWMTSSKEGLKSKGKNEIDAYGFHRIEDEICRFVKEDLYSVAVNDLYYELMAQKNALHVLKQLYIENVKDETETKKRWTNRLETVKKEIYQLHNENQFKVLEQKITELYYYVEKRVSDRFTELFQEAFNPTTIRKGKSEEIEEAYRSFLVVIEDALYRDLQVTGYRIEKMVTHHFHAQYDDLIKKLKDFQIPIVLTMVQMENWEEIEFQRLQGIGYSFKEMKPQLKKIGNTKWYFEGNGKKEVMVESKQVVLNDVKSYLKIEAESTVTQVLTQYKQMTELASKNYMKEADEFVAPILFNQGNTFDENVVNEVIKILEKIEKNSLS